jgi:hypothetical protein
MYWREFANELLEPATSLTATALAAPRNKLRALFTGSIDAVFRHPHQLDVDAIVKAGDLLIVRGDLAGMEAETVMAMKLILNGVHQVLSRQLGRPHHERTPVALVADEFHLIATETYARSLAILRSAGLMALAGWQHSAQMSAPLQAAVRSLLRNRMQFATGEVKDAQDATALLRETHATIERDAAGDRLRARFSTDQLLRLPPHWAACSFMPGGSRASGCIGQTFPVTLEPDRLQEHLRLQRERGGCTVERLPTPEGITDVTLQQNSRSAGNWRQQPATSAQHRKIRAMAQRAGALDDLEAILREAAGVARLDQLTKGKVDAVLAAVRRQGRGRRPAGEPAGAGSSRSRAGGQPARHAKGDEWDVPEMR